MSEEGFKPGRIHRLDGCFQGRLERFLSTIRMLAAALEGVPIRFPLDQYLQARRSYRELLSK